MQEKEIKLKDVMELLGTVSERDVTWVRTPTGQAVMIYFEARNLRAYKEDLPFENGKYAIEINLHAPSVWLHYEDGEDGTETVWKNKSSW